MNCKRRGSPGKSAQSAKPGSGSARLGKSEHDGRANLGTQESTRGPIADNKVARKLEWK
jgi:hypothetical protein